MANGPANLTIPFSSQTQEQVHEQLNINGEIPTWLNGSFVSNGPTQFEVGNQTFNHWFDGFAMLKMFRFHDGKVRFQNRFLQSQQYIQSTKLGHLSCNEFATYVDDSVWGNLQQFFKQLIHGEQYDNCNVNTMRLASRYIAMTESNHLLEFDLNDLSTKGAFHFADQIHAHLSCAHPQFDPITGEMIQVNIEIGGTSKYHVSKIAPNSTQRTIIHSYESDSLFYMHCFCITHSYVILVKTPLQINKYKMMVGLPFNSTLFWQEGGVATFVIIDRRDGSVREIHTDPFVCVHAANAYQHGPEIVLDLICYEPGNPYSDMVLSNLRSDHPDLLTGRLRRYLLDPQANTCRLIDFSAKGDHVEFPRINETLNTQPYRYVYLNKIAQPHDLFYSSIQKMDLESGTQLSWEVDNAYPGETVFVPNPHPQSEDDGVLLSIVYHADSQCSSLVIIQAHTMQQIAQVLLPFHLPFGLHGNFFPG